MQWDQTATIADNGVTGSLVYRRTRAENCLYGGFYRQTVTELIEYDCDWVRVPCRCSGGPTELASMLPSPMPAVPAVTRLSALEIL